MKTVLRNYIKQKHDWEYLLRDYLELKCKLDIKEMRMLIKSLRHEEMTSYDISSQPAFMIGDRIITISEKKMPTELWVYYPAGSILEKKSIW